MPQLIWTPAALQDIQRLYRFLAEKDLNSAKRAVVTIRRSINILAHQPQVGRPIEEMDTEFREWPIDFGNSGYIALYRFDGNTAVLLAVRHQSEAGY
ncbi:type II toxin-antitoxin system RelE/ParE family toxin [Serratia proteamaculans]|uniref:Type II toxin-antitoxin system RelE/ParE family toxin n=1 Tax=Serratia proteamaculans TaxID=28151 RepID=A0A5Q2V4Q9_SERPR|nr:type II toxin-antitoxin system RelE/ParE family toxin [Serratia proteamaculans]QGH60442.1 type II toxin-antitoxin system RelE/ParE family toxin [Serratia proteamaculans]